ncbi:MAG: D-alanyl-D-alanine carboxypeptidase/D-alanyl-D-alanine-endopeptidase [Prevotella sp.]
MLRTLYVYILLSLFAFAYAYDGGSHSPSGTPVCHGLSADSVAVGIQQGGLAADTIEAAADTLDTDTIVGDTIPSLTVQERIAALLATDMFQTSQVGLMAYDLTADTVIYAYNERQTLRPASTMKLLTAITALDRFGDSYRYSTSLRYHGALYDTPSCGGTDDKEPRHILIGDIIAVGGMDPRFGTDDMKAFAEAVQRERIDTIYGMVKADRSFKTADLLGKGWCWDDDNPVLTPLPWNRKDTFIEKLRSALADEGVTVLPVSEIPKDTLGETRYVPRQETSKTICTRHHSIDQILIRMMKESDNLYAESMFYQIAAAETSSAARATHAVNAMKRLIRRVGLDPSRYNIADGSGLSLYNYQTAELQTLLLRYAFKTPDIYGHLYPSLPIAGKDGTLKRRMRSAPTLGNVHAKTGTLMGVSSLAGYLTAKNGNTICFSIINQGVMHASNAKRFQDKVCRLLCLYE